MRVTDAIVLVGRVHESVKVAAIILQPHQKYVTQITASSEGTHRSTILTEYARLVSEFSIGKDRSVANRGLFR